MYQLWLYEKQSSTEAFDKIRIKSRFKITDDLQTFGIAEFTCDIVEWLQEFTFVEIYEIHPTGGKEKKFRWFVKDIEPRFKEWGRIDVVCASEKGFLDLMLAHESIEFYSADYKQTSPSYPSWAIWLSYWETWSWRIATITWAAFTETWIVWTKDYQPVKQIAYVHIRATNDLWKSSWGTVSVVWSWAGINISLLVQDLIDYYNNNYWTSYSLQVLNDNKTDTTVAVGDNYFSIIDEACQYSWLFWDVQEDVVRIWYLLWTDKTKDNVDFTQIYFDWAFQNSSQIKDIKVKWSTYRTNVLILDNWTEKKIFNRYNGTLYKSDIRQKRWGDIDKGSSFLESLDRFARSYMVDLEPNSLDAEIWDKISLKVINTNSFFNIDTSVYVVSKETEYSWWEVVRYWFQEFQAAPLTSVNRARDVQKNEKYNIAKQR